MKKYICGKCGYIYDPLAGDPQRDIKPGTVFWRLPDYWLCPQCGADKAEFSLKEGGMPKQLSEEERSSLGVVEDNITDEMVARTNGKKGHRIPDVEETLSAEERVELGAGVDSTAAFYGSSGGRGAGSVFKSHPIIGKKSSGAPPNLTSDVSKNTHSQEEAGERLEQLTPALQQELRHDLGLGKKFVPPTPIV